MSLPYVEIAKAANTGSPFVLEVAGRALGLGQTERDALAAGRIPGWLLAVVGLGLGLAVGIEVHRRWPDKTPNVFGKEKA